MNEIDIRIRRGESFIIASDGQFLGKLCLNKFDTEGINNEYGLYGSRYSTTSIFNQYSMYGSKYSSLSPFNEYTRTPPQLYLKGILWGVLTVNAWIYGNKLSPYDLNQWMAANNLNW